MSLAVPEIQPRVRLEMARFDQIELTGTSKASSSTSAYGGDSIMYLLQ